MRFTYNWLKEHLETQANVETIVECLNAIGLEVEDVKDPQKTYKDFTVAQIVQAKRHEQADKLWHCHVCIDDNKPPVEIVCGAPNVRVGLKCVFAKPKTYIPGTNIIIEKAVIRGVTSYGMLCSEKELMISDNHDGIIELPSEAIVGHACHSYLGMDDITIEIGITPNRGDCLGVYGIARELSAAGLGQLKPLSYVKHEDDFACPLDVELQFKKDEVFACTDFAGRVIRDVKNCESPLWLQKRLQLIGLRPINALVDITNYVAYDYCRPLHVFDNDKLSKNIHVRYARSGEEFDALDNKHYIATTQDCVIADDTGILSLAGVIGGISTSTELTTQNVFIESAQFDPVIVAKTGRRFGIISDARQRFERGIDTQSSIVGIEMATALIMSICGGKPSSIIYKKNGKQKVSQTIEFPLSEIERLSGISIASDEVKTILLQLGFEVSFCPDKEVYLIGVPSHRHDICGNADIVEEVIRIYGVEKIPSVPLPRLPYLCKPLLTTTQKMILDARRLTAARGLIETMSWSFISHEEALNFGLSNEKLILKNPISKDMSVMRPSLLPGLIRTCSYNERYGQKDFALFELGQSFQGLDKQGQSLCLSGVRVGSACYAQQSRQWQHAEKNVSYLDAKQDVQAILVALGLNKRSLKIIESAQEWFHPGYAGQIGLGTKNIIAHFGMLHPNLVKYYDIKQPLTMFEIILSNVPLKTNKSTRSLFKKPVAKPIYRDLAFVVDKTTSAGELNESLLRADRKFIKEVTLFDVYQGKCLAENEKSLAFEIVLMPSTPNPSEQWIEDILQNIIDTAQKYCNAKLRQ